MEKEIKICIWLWSAAPCVLKRLAWMHAAAQLSGLNGISTLEEEQKEDGEGKDAPTSLERSFPLSPDRLWREQTSVEEAGGETLLNRWTGGNAMRSEGGIASSPKSQGNNVKKTKTTQK